MANLYRVILFNADPAETRDLRALIQKTPGARVIAEVSDPGRLEAASRESPADVLLLNLDPDPDPVIAAAGSVLGRHAEELAVVAMGSSEDSDLIMSLLHAGIREFLPKPVDAEQLAKAIGRVAHHKDAAPRGRIVAVLGVAGGVGATTVATNLAVELAQLCGKDVGLFDLDFQYGQVGIFLNLLPTYTSSDALSDPAGVDMEVLQRVMCRTDHGVDVLARPHHFEQAEAIDPSRAIRAIGMMQDAYPYVVLDGPHRFDAPARQIIQLADHVVMLMQLTVPAVRNVTRTFQEFDRHGVRLDNINLVVNRMGIYKDLDIAQAEKALNAKIRASIPDDWPTVRDAVNLGDPLVKAAPKSKVRAAIESLAKWIHSGQDIPQETAVRKEGIFGLFKR